MLELFLFLIFTYIKSHNQINYMDSYNNEKYRVCLEMVHKVLNNLIL